MNVKKEACLHTPLSEQAILPPDETFVVVLHAPWAKSWFQGVAYREYAAFCAGKHDAQSGALKVPKPMKLNRVMK